MTFTTINVLLNSPHARCLPSSRQAIESYSPPLPSSANLYKRDEKRKMMKHTIIGRSLTILFPSSSSTSIPQRTLPVSTSHIRSTPSHPPPARRPYLPTPRWLAVPFLVLVLIEWGWRESIKVFREKGENAKEPVPDSRPWRTWSVSPDRASNSLIVESWPPLFSHTCVSNGNQPKSQKKKKKETRRTRRVSCATGPLDPDHQPASTPTYSSVYSRSRLRR